MGRKQLKALDSIDGERRPFLNYQKRYFDNYFLTVPPRDAVRTSITSKRCRYIWTSHSDLRLDFINVLWDQKAYNSRNNCQFE